MRGDGVGGDGAAGRVRAAVSGGNWLLDHTSPLYIECVDYFFLLGACVNADPAALLAALEDFGLLSTLPAFEAAFFPVCSFFAIVIAPSIAKPSGHSSADTWKRSNIRTTSTSKIALDLSRRRLSRSNWQSSFEMESSFGQRIAAPRSLFAGDDLVKRPSDRLYEMRLNHSERNFSHANARLPRKSEVQQRFLAACPVRRSYSSKHRSSRCPVLWAQFASMKVLPT